MTTIRTLKCNVLQGSSAFCLGLCLACLDMDKPASRNTLRSLTIVQDSRIRCFFVQLFGLGTPVPNPAGPVPSSPLPVFLTKAHEESHPDTGHKAGDETPFGFDLPVIHRNSSESHHHLTMGQTPKWSNFHQEVAIFSKTTGFRGVYTTSDSTWRYITIVRPGPTIEPQNRYSNNKNYLFCGSANSFSTPYPTGQPECLEGTAVSRNVQICMVENAAG